MRKLVCMIIICATLFQVAPARAANEADDTTEIEVYVNGIEQTLENEAFLFNWTTYVPLRELAMDMGARHVLWNGKEGYAEVEADGLLIYVDKNLCYMIANDRYLYMPDGCIVREGTAYVPVRQLCAAFGAEIEWNKETKTILIETTGEPIESGETFYNEEDLLWLSRIIEAEASGEEMKGKVAVGEVVMNRVNSDKYPDSVHDVIFDFKCGVQFTPAYTGAIYNMPSEEAEIAAKLVLDGTAVAKDCYYFAASYIAASSWAGRNRTFVAQIGNHCFYA